MAVIKYRTYRILLLLIILLGLFLRFYNLPQNPPALDWDEASSIYNGYSIAKTGRDEFLKPFPILFRAFDGYVPPVLIYFDAISSSVFGLTVFAARFPNAFLGTISIWGIYLLICSVTKNRKVALFSSLFLAISPWHISYSRVGTFAPLPISFIIFGTYFFFRGLTKKTLLLFAGICFVIATLSYFSAYVFVPLYLFALIIIYRKQISLFHSAILLGLIVSTTMMLFFLPGGQTRLRGVSSISDPDLIKQEAIFALNEPEGKFFHNRRLVYAQKLLEGYFNHLSFPFLFNKSDTVSRFVVPGPGFGLLYWWDLPILIIGIYQLLHRKQIGWQLLLVWILLAPIAAAPTFPQPASTRTVLIVPALAAAIAYGFWHVSRNSSKIVRLGVVVFFGLNMMLFLHQYFVHYPQEKADGWFAANRPLFSFLNQNTYKDQKVTFFINQPDYLDQAHIFTAFYNRIEPAVYQSYGGTRLGRFGTTGEFSIGRFHFMPNDCTFCEKEIEKDREGLFVIASEIPLIHPVIAIPNKDNHPAIFIYYAKDVSLDKLVRGRVE